MTHSETPTPARSVPPSARQSVGFGVIGARSFVATRAVMPAIDAADRCHIAAASARSGPLDQRWSTTSVDDYDAVVEHPDVEVVYIPLPNGMHCEWTERAAAAGKHVLCEKPLAPHSATARAMAATCFDAGVLLGEAWMTPFDNRWTRAIDDARRGAIGDVRHIAARFTFTIGPDAHDNYRWEPDQGGGALLDVGIYCLGAAVELWGADATVTAASQVVARSGVDATTVVDLEWDDGQTAHVRCSFVEAEMQRLELVGSSGRLIVDDEAFTGARSCSNRIVVARPDTDGDMDGDQDCGSPDDVDVDVDVADEIEVERNDPYQSMVEAFGNAVRGDIAWPRPIEMSIEMLGLIERVREAAR